MLGPRQQYAITAVEDLQVVVGGALRGFPCEQRYAWIELPLSGRMGMSVANETSVRDAVETLPLWSIA